MHDNQPINIHNSNTMLKEMRQFKDKHIGRKTNK